MNEKKPNNNLSWPLNSEVVGREIVNEKMPNKCMYIEENKEIIWEYDEETLGVKILEIYSLAYYCELLISSKLNVLRVHDDI